jgi:hypothetical protein
MLQKFQPLPDFVFQLQDTIIPKVFKPVFPMAQFVCGKCNNQRLSAAEIRVGKVVCNSCKKTSGRRYVID